MNGFLNSNDRRKKNWVNIKVVIIVFTIEALLCAFEVKNTLACHNSGKENWSFFFSFLANFPASIAALIIGGFFNNQLTNSSFLFHTISTGCIFLTIGTIWWVAVIHFLIAAKRFLHL
jgi:hypothetical protein